MLIDGSKHRTFKALVDYYVKEYSTGQIANQLCDVMDGLPTPAQHEAAQWTIDAIRNMATDRAFWKQDCVQVLSDIRSTAVSYFERQREESSDEVLFDIVQACGAEFCSPAPQRKVNAACLQAYTFVVAASLSSTYLVVRLRRLLAAASVSILNANQHDTLGSKPERGLPLNGYLRAHGHNITECLKAPGLEKSSVGIYTAIGISWR